MNLFDSHCHLDDRSFRNNLKRIVQRANQNGIDRMMTVGIDAATSKRAVEIANKYKGVVASVGVHPHRASTCNKKVIDQLANLADNKKVRAWGEIGLDFNRMYSPRNDQELWFVEQLQAADELKLPIILHERDSEGRLLELLVANPNPNRRGTVHCFSGNRNELHSYLELGYCIGVTGIVTMQQRGVELRKLVRDIPLDRLLIETDAPYLTPTPQKNKTRRNEPAFVKSVLLKLAQILDLEPDMLAETTSANAKRVFNITA
jgi:TatD DNase family protein